MQANSFRSTTYNQQGKIVEVPKLKSTKYEILIRTSERFVVKRLDINGSPIANRPYDFPSSVKHSHSLSSSALSVAARIITFWHLICKDH